jgi:tetratricopeptide (TPR) repeat protein
MPAAKRIAFPVILLAAISLLYAPVRQHAFVNYDDPDYVTANSHVRAGLTADSVRWAFTSTHGANWFPLTWLSHMLDVELFGLDSGRHHLTNVFLHAVSSILLYLTLLRMTGARWRAGFVAAAFALHPLRVESVAWVAERKDVLCGLFWMLALLAYARYVERPGRGRYALLALAFCGALLSKPMAVTLPAVLLLLDYWPLRRRPAIGEKLPLFALSAAAAVITLLVQGGGGAVATAGELALGSRIANALVSWAVYGIQTLWPAGLAVFYPFRVPAVWEALAALAGLLAVTAVAARRRELLAGWLWFLVTLLPVIGLVQVGLQAHADRYTYLPSIGLAIVLAWAAPAGRVSVAVGAAVCLAWSAVAWRQLGTWRDSTTLFTRALAVTERNYVAHNNLGVALRDSGQSDAARRHFQAAIEIRPAYADARSNLGESLLRAGRLDEAERHIRTAVELLPDLAEARVNLGAVLSRRGQADAAAAEYRRALALNPASAEAHAGLGAVLTDREQWQDAQRELTEAIALRPEYADAHYNLGRFYGLVNRPADAEREFRETLRLRPSDAEAHYNLGTALAAQKRIGDAIDEFREAIRLRPDYVNAHFNLGAALAMRGDCRSGAASFAEALRLKPDFEEARKNLAYCKADSGLK